tara:strand:- start:1206 stop:1601 length:396 start_codon:yes stop_codon:yes gene_type:complete
MKIALFTTCFITLFVVSESSFSKGFTMGFVSSNIERKTAPKTVDNIDYYYYFTRDTALQKFPPSYAHQCITEKKHIIEPLPTIVEVLMGIILTSTFMCCVCMCAPDDEDVHGFITGYIVGRVVENMLNDYD